MLLPHKVTGPIATFTCKKSLCVSHRFGAARPNSTEKPTSRRRSPAGGAGCCSGLRAASRRLQTRESQMRQPPRRSAKSARRRLAAYGGFVRRAECHTMSRRTPRRSSELLWVVHLCLAYHSSSSFSLNGSPTCTAGRSSRDSSVSSREAKAAPANPSRPVSAPT